MNNTLMSLNNYLFEQLERINDDSLTDEELEKQIKKAEVINKTAENIIRNNETALKAVNIASEYGYIVPDNIRDVLGIKQKPQKSENNLKAARGDKCLLKKSSLLK